MKKEYTLVTSNRQAKPRSKRLRELGGGTSGSGGATIVNVSSNQGVAKDPNSHTHANRADLDKLSTDVEGYAYITQVQEVEEIDDDGNRRTTWAPVKNKAKAGHADSAAVAHDLTEDSPVRSQFLSKVAADVAAGRITFLEGIEVVKAAALRGGLNVGQYVEGAIGAGIDAAGNAEVESITVRSYLKVFELIYNRLNALEGNTSFADVGTIDSVNSQILTMRKRWEGDFTAFQPGDIVYGYVNDLHNTNGGGYYKAWAWVRSVDRENNTLQVASYPGTEVPGGRNYPLREGMVITRWGNNIEANAVSWANPAYNAVIEKRDNGYFNTRQSSFFISCEDGNLVELMGVNKPILEPGNYGTVLGKIPAGLLSYETEKLINKDQPYLYARGIIVQDLIRIDYDGAVTRMSNYRGTWSAETAASETEYYRSTTGAYDTVTWNNCLWQCVASGTTDEPSEATGSWVNMSGGVEIPELRVWKIMPNTDIVTLRYNANSQTVITPEKVSCAVLLTSTEGTVTYNSSLDLNTDHGVKLYYSLDGTAWKEFVIGNTEPLETEYSEAFEAETSTADNPIYLVLGGDDVAATEIGDRIYFELRNATDVLARSVIPVVKDGYEGKDGQLVYPAGNYSASAVYTATGDTSPVVMYESNYYMLLRGKTYQGEQMPENRQNPAADVANGGDDVRWRLFDKFNAVFADVLMAAFAKLGGAIFYGDYMISQNGTIYGSEVQGVDKNGVAYYRQFTDGVTYGTFIPNLMLNFLTGEVRAMKGNIKGTIEADSGKIGGFNIGSSFIGLDKNDETSAGMSLHSSGIRFTDDNYNLVAAIGSNVLPASVGIPALGRFENKTNMPLGTNYGIIIDVNGAPNNIAISAKGSINTNGLCGSYGMQVITLSASNTVYHRQYNSPTWLIKCAVSTSYICLPDINEVRDQLGISKTTPFCVRLTIIADAGNTDKFYVQGRNTSLKNADGVAFLDKDIYPYRLNNNAEKQLTDGLTMSKGDIAEFQLVYDGTNYYAYILNNRS